MDAKELMRLSGSVESVIFSNDENGYTVMRLALDGGGKVTLVGTAPYAAPGEIITAVGRWEEHQLHGAQFRAEVIDRAMPKTEAEICAYLASGVIKGVGPVTARTIVETFGSDSLTVIENAPEKLTELKGITSKRASEISLSFRRRAAMRRLMEFFSDNGIRLEYAMRLYRSYGDDAMAALSANPYLITGEFYGASFADADRLALNMGFEADSPERVEAAVMYELDYNAENGHCFIPRDKLSAAVSALISVDGDCVAEAMDRLEEAGEMIVEDIAGRQACYTASIYKAEVFVAERIRSMAGTVYDKAAPERLISLAEKEMGITLAERQRDAVRAAAQYGIFALTGGPGTGKTTTIRAILGVFDKMGLKTSLAAPTGRAAKRMGELCRREASTVHRLLEMGYDADLGALVFKHNERDMLEADAVILDEASMVDIILMKALLSAMRPGCRLVMVGDADQLPPVGPGNMFGDVLRSGVINSVSLTEIFRQAEESRIVLNAHLINRGELPELKANKGDFFFMRRKSAEAATETILELCAKRLPENMHIMPDEIQVISPSRRYASGTKELNRRLQEAINPPAEGKAEKAFGDVVFRVGDRVMQVRNNYDIMWTKNDGTAGVGIFNGDVGRITSLDNSEQILTVEYEDRSAVYSFDMLSELEPAYAVTVHKSQGSEYRAVILALVKGAPSLMSRSVLYTAVTRAKELLIIVGDDEAVAEMVANNRTQRRYSGLKTRLTEGR
ncbi:MAG: ATP-dependent RecD-like DNA helicase [Oscillospiraceae bacterium]|nr:ATP-dependent RecD-like DNA helicase [Oscillospiraceae bacterium]